MSPGAWLLLPAGPRELCLLEWRALRLPGGGGARAGRGTIKLGVHSRTRNKEGARGGGEWEGVEMSGLEPWSRRLR